MKIRNGFVSNSSSSSFMVFAKQEDIDKSLNKVKDKCKDFIRSTFLSGGKTMIFNGEQYLSNHGVFYSDDISESFHDISDEFEFAEDENIYDMAWKEIDVFFKSLGQPNEVGR